MSDEHGGAPDDGDDDADASTTATGPDEDIEEELAELRSKLDAFEEDIDDRTVHREEIERDLKRYVRRRVGRGHATGWGPYLVLLYGTAMTIGAFYFLGGGWAILAMLVIWLSTLGLYTLMVLVGVGVTMAGLPGRLRNTVEEFRS
jgi:predicted phage tail protein